ncbi:flagellar biosynthesis protein FlhB [Phenylobacterium sp. LjRoot225]|uniref:flagellar biosynthesis protein FlhB n=1 Tax=Phenylobacterium sp. LjRoot225 TaxID=3342285 RepID=UPI003ECC7721
MAEENEGASRTEEPTPRKLEQAREKGDVVKTPELPQLASLAAVVAVLAISGGWLCRNLALQLLPFIAHPDSIAIAGGGGMNVAQHALKAALPIILMVMLSAAAAGAAGHLLQTGLMFTPDKLKFDFTKLSPMQGLKRLFGIDGLIHFGKSLLKVAITTALAWWIVKPHLTDMERLATLDPAAILPFLADLLRRLVFAVMALLLVITGADWFVQKQRFMARMRMSKEELKEEFKNTEGDPHVKAKQKQIRAERARRRMMQAVPKATLVVMNPTHYAVALKYVQGEDDAPICVAKGMDAIALKIRDVAKEANVPVIEDPPLARALYAAVEIDDVIPQAHFEAVAKIIGFILRQSRRRATARPL